MAIVIAASKIHENVTKTIDSLFKPFATNDLNTTKKLIKCASKDHIVTKSNLKNITV